MDELLSAFSGLDTSSNDQLVTKFAEIMHINSDIATFFLEASNWNVEGALNSYLSSVGDQSNLVAQVGQVPQGSAGIIDPHNVLSTNLLPNQPFQLQWILTNTGSSPWPQNSMLLHTEGPTLNGPKTANVGMVPQGQMVNQTVTLAAPSQPGQYASTWRLKYDGGYFGEPIWIITMVVAPPPGVATFPDPAQQMAQQMAQQVVQQQQAQGGGMPPFMGMGLMNALPGGAAGAAGGQAPPPAVDDDADDAMGMDDDL